MPLETPDLKEAERWWSPYRDPGSTQAAYVDLSVGSEQYLQARGEQAVSWLDSSDR